MIKIIRKNISKLFPKGELKEKLKLFFYNIVSSKNISFGLVKNEKLFYKTTYLNHTVITNEALYFILPEFINYQYFYKVKTNDVVIDAGANNAHLTILFSKIVKKNGCVIAFEPDNFNIVKMKNNISLNSDLENNISIDKSLLWDENKSIDFFEEGSVASSAIWIPSVDKCVKKEAVKLDDWIISRNMKKIDFIKMDIEGAEIKALEGCKNTILKFQPNIAIAAYHLVEGELSYIKVEQFFKKIKYPYKTIHFKNNEIITFAGPSLKNII